MKNLLSLIFILSIALTACSDFSSTSYPETPNTLPNTPTSPLPTIAIAPPLSPIPSLEGNAVTPESLPRQPDLVNRAISDLAQRLNIATDKIAFVSAQNDEFPAANFGCPDQFETNTPSKKSTSTLPGNLSQPDNGTSPAFVIATEITLDVPSHTTRYIYRGKGTQLVFCFEKGY